MLNSILSLHFSLSFFELLFLIFAFSLTVQVFYYFLFYSRIAFKKIEIKDLDQNPTPISVVICARNEARKLEILLPKLFSQSYPNFQVVVVNDCSEDDSASILYLLEQEYPNLYVTTIVKDNKFSHSKKLAMVVGLKAAKHDRVIVTDADCTPGSDLWLATIASNFSEKTEFVLAYGAYSKRRSILNYLIRFDTVFIAIQYLSFAMAGMPYMGVGRNLSHKKSTFFKHGGYRRHYWIVSGSDDLLVNELAVKANTKVELRPESFTYSETKKKWTEWFRQKQRHFLSSPFYKTRDKIMLSTELFSRTFFYLTFIILITNKWKLELVLSLFGFRFVIQHLVLGLSMKKLKSIDLIYSIFVLDFMMPLVNFTIHFFGLFIKNKNIWK